MHEKNQVLNSSIFNEIVDVSCTSCHEHSLHNYSQEQFDSVQVEIQFEQPCHDRYRTEIFAGCLEPVAE